MPVERAVVEAYLAKLNAARRPDQGIKLEAFDPPGKFTLSFPNRAMPEGQCIDQDFTDIQFALHEERQIDTNIVGGQLRDDGRYWMRYEVIEWD